jgi:AraC-like DNA-binding protein
LANVAGVSSFHFSRAFKESFGLPPHRYLTSR